MQKLKTLINLALGFIPQKLPIGAADLTAFSTKLCVLYGIPDLPSYHLAIATMIMHMGPQEAYKSPFWFFRSLRAAQAKEVAYQVIAADRELRNKEEREAKQVAYDKMMADKLSAATAVVTAVEGASQAVTQSVQA